jgi:hypothetical protein
MRAGETKTLLAQISASSFSERYAVLNQRKHRSFTKSTLITRNLIYKFKNTQTTAISPGLLLNHTEV